MKLPRYNAYQCEFGCLIVTVDVDKGVTPFEIKCRRKPTKDRPIAKKYLDSDGECIGRARSSFYPKRELPKHYPPVEWEWCLPSEEEIVQEIKKWKTKGACEQDVRDWYNGEALMLRPRTDREPIYHDEK